MIAGSARDTNSMMLVCVRELTTCTIRPVPAPEAFRGQNVFERKRSQSKPHDLLALFLLCRQYLFLALIPTLQSNKAFRPALYHWSILGTND